MPPVDSFTARQLPGSVGPKGPMFGTPRRRGRRLAAFAAIVLLILVPLVIAGAAGGPSTTNRAVAQPAAAKAPAETAQVMAPVDESAGEPFARVGAVELVLPGEEILLIGYHEASMPSAVALHPHGHGLANENQTKFTLPPDGEGPGYLVLSSRGRRQAATSAVDLVMHDDATVVSPVDGTVVGVEPYALYGRHPDTRIEIAPKADPDLRVVLIHVRDVRVHVGDELEAGVTPLAAGPNRFDFASHIDRYFPKDRWPHVHLEVKSVDEAAPVGTG